MNKNADAGPVRYWNKGTQSGIGTLLCRNEMLNAGMPMPAASVSIKVSSYKENRRKNKQILLTTIRAFHSLNYFPNIYSLHDSEQALLEVYFEPSM
jgi:hypothetical protein